MKLLRSLTAGLCILLGVVLLVAWAISYGITRLVTDGDVVAQAAAGALENEQVTQVIVEQVFGRVTADLRGQGLDVDSLGLGGTLETLIAALVESDQFSATIADAVTGAQQDVERQLTDPDREPAPLVLRLDVGASVTRSLGDTPLIGDAIASADIEPVEVPVMEADQFERVRGVYVWIDRLARWGGWLGLTLLVAGLLISPRKQWFLPKLFFGLGVASLVGAAFAWWVTEDRVARLSPGGEDGAIAGLARVAISDEFFDRTQDRLLIAALVCLAVAAALFLLVKITRMGGGRKRGAHEDDARTAQHAR